MASTAIGVDWTGWTRPLPPRGADRATPFLWAAESGLGNVHLSLLRTGRLCPIFANFVHSFRAASFFLRGKSDRGRGRAPLSTRIS